MILLLNIVPNVSAATWDYYVPKYDAAKDDIVDVKCQRDEYYYYCPGEPKKLISSDNNLPASREVVYDYSNKKYYSVIKKDGQTTIKPGAYWVK